VVARGVTHVSLYALQVEPGTPLHAKAARGTFVALPDDAAAARYEDAGALLERAGFSRYEVSSWAKPGFESRHNEGYWVRRPYLGLGPGAHSFDGRRRWGNEESVTRYYETLEAGDLPRLTISEVTDEAALEEVVFLGLRRARGVRRTAVTKAAPRTAASWLRWAEDAGAIRAGRARVRPTEHGLMTAVETLAELFAREAATPASGFHRVDSERVLTAGESRV
jgi:coproporphyrinogen III oxidase-like Fe-S oxidoreductase